MRTKHFIYFIMISIALPCCMKHASDYVPGYGDAVNTWTFTDGQRHYFGNLPSNAILHTTPQSNNTYTLEMTGTERSGGQVMTMVISLNEPALKKTTYQSGISGSDHATAFFYSGSAASRDAIYSSANNNPGAVMNFIIVRQDTTNSTATIAFNGEAFDAAGNKTKILQGKVTAYIVFQ